MSATEKSKGSYKQFFACECGSRFRNEDELKIHFCLSHHGEKEVKVKVQRVYMTQEESPKKTKNAVRKPAIIQAPSQTSPVKIAKANLNKNQLKIVSVQEEKPNLPIKEEKIGYKKVYEDLSKYAKRNDNTINSKPNYRTIQYPKVEEAVTLYKSEPNEPNVVQTNVIQKKNLMKPIVIPISQMKPNSYVIQKPAKKEPKDNIQVIKCGDNKYLVRNNSPIKNNVTFQECDGRPVYVINGGQYTRSYQSVIVQQNPCLGMEIDHAAQFAGIKLEDSYQEYIVTEDTTQEYVEKEEQEVEFEQEDYPSEFVTEEYITGDTESAIEGEEGDEGEEIEELEEEQEEEEDYDTMLEAQVVEAAMTEGQTKRKYKHKAAKDGVVYQCSVCERAFSKRMSLTQHMIQMHRPTIVQTTLVPNKRKRKIKEEKKVIQCDLCDREFFGKQAIAVHRVKAHIGTEHIVRPYKCELCEKAYRNQTLLTYHMRTHTGERPYKCTYCPKAFTMGQGLQWHERIHTGERPEQCRKCGKRFKCQTALLRHEKVHTGDKPYACPHCQKCFSQSNSMKLHVITVHMKLPSPYKSHHNRYRKRREKLEKEKNASVKQENDEDTEEANEEGNEEMNEDGNEERNEEMNEEGNEEGNEQEMQVYFGSEDDAAGYEEVYA